MSLPPDLVSGIAPNILKRYRDRVITEPAREIRRHPPHIRYALVAIFLTVRAREITDGLVDLLILTIHRIGAKAEKTVAKELLNEIKKVRGKPDLLFKMASAAWEHPDEMVRQVIFPAVGEHTIQEIIREYRASGSAYTLHVNTRMRASYRNHYRRMLPLILNTLEFRSNNQTYCPLIKAIGLLKTYHGRQCRCYPENEVIPCDGIVPTSWNDVVYELDHKGHKRINRIAYELCVFGVLRDKLRCKEIWVVGADRYRNPDDDVPSDFEANRLVYYEMLGHPTETEPFLSTLQHNLDESLRALDTPLPHNTAVEILKKNKGWIKVSPLAPQTEPQNLARIKAAISSQWQTVSLLDMLKEADMRIKFTQAFKSVAQREILDRATLQKRP